MVAYLSRSVQSGCSLRNFASRVSLARWGLNSISQNVRCGHCQIYELNSGTWSESSERGNLGGEQFRFFIRLPYVLKTKRGRARYFRRICRIPALFRHFLPTFLFRGASRATPSQLLNRATGAYVALQDTAKLVRRSAVLRDCKKRLPSRKAVSIEETR